MVAAQQQQSASSVSELEDNLEDSESGEDDVVNMSEPQSPGEGQEGSPEGSRLLSHHPFLDTGSLHGICRGSVHAPVPAIYMVPDF